MIKGAVEHHIEKQGIVVDTFELDTLFKKYSEELQSKQSFWKLEHGTDFISSHKYLKDVFDKKGIRYGYGEKDNPDFSKRALENYEIDNDFRESIKDLRALQYAKSTTKSINESIDASRGLKLFPEYSFTVTGRYICKNPNIQNFPKRNTETSKIRRIVVPADPRTDVLASFDYAQGEYKLFADLIGHKDLIDDLNSGADYHQKIADMAKCTRDQAKTVNFAILYGGGPKLISNWLGIDQHDASDLIDEVLSYLGDKGQDFMTKTKEHAEDFKQVVIDSRTDDIITIPIKPEDSYKAVNYRIQGGLAQEVRKAIYKVWDKVPWRLFDSPPYFNIHDAWVFSLNRDALGALISDIKEHMEKSYKSVNGLKMKIDVEVGENFGAMNKYGV